MRHVRLVCGACEADHAPDMKTLECRRCPAPLDAEYTGMGATLDVAGYDVAMPFSDAASMPTLGEGGTPVMWLAKLGAALGLDRLDAKLEYMNPTGSYKDRGTVVMLAVAREQGVEEVVEDSSGNAGASVSAYSARAGIRAHIFAPATAPAAKLKQIRVYGAEVHSIEGPREAATEAAMSFCEQRGPCLRVARVEPVLLRGHEDVRVRDGRSIRRRAPGPYRVSRRKRRAVPGCMARIQ